MAETKYLKCYCDHCAGRIEFPADGIGATIPCPHCGRKTELALEAPKEQKIARPVRGLKWFIAGAAILVVGVVATVAILLTAQRMMNKAREKNEALGQSTLPVRTNAQAAKAPKPVAMINDFAVSPVAIDKAAGSSLAYATGALENQTDRQRFGVTVELQLLDKAGAVLGTTKDYAQVIEPRAEWKYRALLVQKSVASVRVTGVKEQE